MKYAIIGCGRISYYHIESAIANNLEIVAVCDIIEEKALEIKKRPECESVHVYTDYIKMLKEENLDLVAIATPSGKHAEIAINCIEHGCNVIIEKPIALSTEDARQIVEKAEEKGVCACACHQNRFNKSIQVVHKAKEDGRFGKILYSNAYIRWNRDDDYYKLDSWRGTWENDGGALMNQCIHDIDLLLWLNGSEVDQVCAYTDRLVHESISAEDFGCAIVRFKDGSYGIIEGTTDVYPDDLEEKLVVFGKTGTVKVGGNSCNLIEDWIFKDQNENVEELKKETQENPDNVYGFGHYKLYANVIESINNHTAPLVTAKDGYKAVELILGIYKSAAENKPVEFPLDKVSTLDFVGRFDHEK